MTKEGRDPLLSTTQLRQCRQLGDLSHPEIFKFQDVIKIKKINKQFSHSFKIFSTFIFSLQGI